MALRSATFLLLVLATLNPGESSVGNSSHSLKFFSTAISHPSQGQPHLVSVGYVDGQLFSCFDSNSMEMQPRVSWMEKVGREDPPSWKREILHLNEEAYGESMHILRSHYNRKKGLHTLQGKYGCNISAEGRKSGFNIYCYDGKGFISFDTENSTWVALDPLAKILQMKWNYNPGYQQRKEAYLEEKCIQWLEICLSYQKEALQRTGTPKVTVSSRTEVEDGMEAHVCRIHGFYPREIDASWRRDGEVWLENTFQESVVPNADGTFHYSLSIQIDPTERGRYRCHVEHDGLQDPLDLELKEPTNSEPTDSKSNLWLIGIVVLALVSLIAGIYLCKKCHDRYRAASRRHQDENNAVPLIHRGSDSSAASAGVTASAAEGAAAGAATATEGAATAATSEEATATAAEGAATAATSEEATATATEGAATAATSEEATATAAEGAATPTAEGAAASEEATPATKEATTATGTAAYTAATGTTSGVTVATGTAATPTP